MNPINHGSDRFLIVRTDRVGDVVLTLPMARAIKRALPGSYVAFLARDYTQPIVERCPDVDEIFVAEPELSMYKLIRIFRNSKVDVAFFPSPRFRHAFAAFVARIPKRVGTGYRWYSFLFTNRIYKHRKTAEHHEVEYNLGMLRSIGVSKPADERTKIQLRNEERSAVGEWVALHFGNSNAKFAVLHVTNGGSTAPWPIQNFVELGRTIFERYGMTIILTGLRQETTVLEQVAISIGEGGAQVFAGHSLAELAALLERAAIVVTTGTGPGHLAAALGAPTVGLFPLPAAISAARWGFRGPKASNISPEAKEGCPACDSCTCMERLEVRNVWNAVEVALTAKGDS